MSSADRRTGAGTTRISGSVGTHRVAREADCVLGGLSLGTWSCELPDILSHKGSACRLTPLSVPGKPSIPHRRGQERLCCVI